MTKCEKYEMFMNDHPDVAFRFMIWEEEILPNFNNIKTDDDITDIPDADFDFLN